MKGENVQMEEFIQDVARGAGEIVRQRFHTKKTWRAKSGPGDVVTEVDEEAERYILGRITSQFPNDSILSEECGAIGAGEEGRVWVIDPIDGTRNYMMGVPFFCVSIGVALAGVPGIGAIYDPIHDEMFFAQRGRGASLNGESIRVSDETSLEDSVISVSWVKEKTDRRRFIEYIEALSRDTSYFRRFGSAALVMAYVACGRLHGYLQAGLNPWDVAAGVVIVEEAGGVVSDFKGNPIDVRKKDIEIVTGSPRFHSVLLNDVILRDRER